ncbi:MAG: hypothetical protein ACTHMY_20020 [Solirubrobacteraceae bacterium]
MRFDTLERALAELEARVDELAEAARRAPAETKLRRYEPAEQILARIELAGPERRLARTHAGVDVHGDGSTQAYLGRVRRRAVDRAKSESAAAALRRVLQDP